MIEAISDKKLKVNDLAKKYEVSDRSIQTKIKKLGFEWD
ncbi:HTH domain-containing protein, partial [Priestia megaterium]